MPKRAQPAAAPEQREPGAPSFEGGPRRNPDETRQRLLSSAAFLFNRDGYHGTDSNKIARHAGFAPGTFYKYFRDKRAALLAVQERHADNEWEGLAQAARAARAADAAGQLVGVLVEAQRTWHGFRSSVSTIAAGDPDVRALRRDHRVRQLDLLAALRDRLGRIQRSREEDALLLFTIERACDSLGDGEASDLRLSERALIRELEALVERALVG
jgi:AcrR family transcriptional regulator